MAEAPHVPFYLDLVIGALVLCTVLLRAWFGAIGLPSLVAFLLLGAALRQLDALWELLAPPHHAVFETLAHLGLVAVLFRVGLESNLPGPPGISCRAGWPAILSRYGKAGKDGRRARWTRTRKSINARGLARVWGSAAGRRC